VIERIHASAKHAETKLVYTVPASVHLTIFSKSQDFHLTLNMIVEMCRGRRDNKTNSADVKSHTAD
jgi:hypothetical protein